MRSRLLIMPSSTLDYKDETCLVAFEAKTAIWIVSEPSPEHVSTIAWLNESSLASFYLAKVEAIQIEGSLPAPQRKSHRLAKAPKRVA